MCLFVLPTMAQTIFTDVTGHAGIGTQHVAFDNYYVTGQAWGDYDGDGWVDLYLTNSDGENKLFRNHGDGTFTLSDLTHQVALASSHSGGASFADYDNDGWLDLYVLNLGANTLFKNLNGNGFANVTATAGVGHHLKGEMATWGDYDSDGDLDLYVTNWDCPECGQSDDYTGNQDALYLNNGNGTFDEVSSLLGEANLRGAGFAATFLDYDNDGDADLYLVNDQYSNPVGNQLWRNDGPGCDGWCFTEVSSSANAKMFIFGMGVAVGDYDHDLDLDLFMSNMGFPVLLQNQLDFDVPRFENVTLDVISGLDDDNISWGTFFFDFNNDSWQDIYLAGGQIDSLTDMRSYLLKNNGDGSFSNISGISGLDDPLRTLGTAYADYDRDGDIDVVVGNRGSGYRLYRNDYVSTESRTWISFELNGASPININAVGARVFVSTTSDDVLMQEVKCGSSHGAGNQLALHFGLGNALVDSVTVRWPDGEELRLGPLSSSTYWQISYPDKIAQLQTIRNGWQLLGLPFSPSNSHVSSVFSGISLDSVLSFSTGYQPEENLVSGVGYWVESEELAIASVTGDHLASLELNLAAGWNLISGISNDIHVSTLVDADNIVEPASLYEYQNGYHTSEYLRAGRGYWIRAREAGTVVIPASQNTNHVENAFDDLSDFPKLNFRDDNGGSQDLFFDVTFDDERAREDYLLPPLPPEGAFDIRLSDGHSACNETDFTIDLQGVDFPLTLNVSNMNAESSLQYVLTELTASGATAEYELSDNDEVVIQNAATIGLAISLRVRVVSTYDLQQNYPNPFNPETTITYDIPVSGNIQLAVYDLLGREVVTLYSGFREQGRHEINWGGTDRAGIPVTSGLYIYRLEAGEEVHTRKMILLR